MSKFFTLLLSVFLMVLFPSLHAGGGQADYPQLTQQQRAQYMDQLQTQVAAAEAKLTDLINEMGNPETLMTPSLKIEIKRMAEMVKVKEILVGEFNGKESLRSELVRSTLLQILSQDIISPQDLANLQSVVDSEKVNIRQYDQEQRQVKLPASVKLAPLPQSPI